MTRFELRACPHLRARAQARHDDISRRHGLPRVHVSGPAWQLAQAVLGTPFGAADWAPPPKHRGATDGLAESDPNGVQRPHAGERHAGEHHDAVLSV